MSLPVLADPFWAAPRFRSQAVAGKKQASDWNLPSCARHGQNYSAVRITEIAFDGQSFKAPELVKKEKKVKKAHKGGEEVKASARPGKTAKKHVAHKKPAAKKAAVKAKKKK